MDLDVYEDEMEEWDDYDDGSLFPYDADHEEIEISMSDGVQCLKHIYSSAMKNTVWTMILVNLSCKLVLCAVKRVSSQNIKEGIGQSVLLISGLILIFYHFHDNSLLSLVSLIFAIFGVVLLNFRRNLTNYLLWIYIFSAIALNELIYFYFDEEFIRLRTFLMCSAMKLISLRRVLKKMVIDEEKENPSFGTLISYLLHPESLPLGGYFPPKLNQSIDDLTSFKLFTKSLLSLTLSFVSLGLSDCALLFFINAGEKFITNFLTNYVPLNVALLFGKIFVAYSAALEFRTSHYFICYLIQSSHNFWGNDITVAKPLMIEYPRSLVDVVIAWDIPMHLWLKENIYIPFKYKFGFAPSIFLTYAVSSYIHGFRFEIWSVLLSLGFFTWIETEIRTLFANAFDACLGARSCSYKSDTCDTKTSPSNMKITFERFRSFFWFTQKTDLHCTRNHQNTPYNSIWVILINLLFSSLAILHLAYLGSTFGIGEGENNPKYVIDTWSNIGFYSHIIGIITVVFYYFVK